MAVTNLNLGPIGASQFQDTANSNAAVVAKAAAGDMFMVEVDNTALAAAVYVKLYDSVGAVVVGTTAPNWIFKIPASVKKSIAFVGGAAFAAGLQVATVAEPGTAGTTAPATPPAVRIIYT